MTSGTKYVADKSLDVIFVSCPCRIFLIDLLLASIVGLL